MKILLLLVTLFIATVSFAQNANINIDSLSYQQQHDMLYTGIYSRLKKAHPYLEIHDRETSNMIFKELEAYRAKFDKTKSKGKEPIDFIRWALRQEISKQK